MSICWGGNAIAVWSIHLITRNANICTAHRRSLERDCRTNVTLSQTWKLKNNNEWKLNSQRLTGTSCTSPSPTHTPPLPTTSPYFLTNFVIPLPHSTRSTSESKWRERLATAVIAGQLSCRFSSCIYYYCARFIVSFDYLFFFFFSRC